MNQSQAGKSGTLPDTEAEDLGTDWRDGVPISLRFDDPYYSLAGGLAETRHVFLTGNNLPARFRDGLAIAELGFGTGLNLLTTILAWQASGTAGRFRFTSFEAFPLPSGDLARALTAFPEVAPLTKDFLAAWTQLAPSEAVSEPQDAQAAQPARTLRFDLGPAEVELILGDARTALPSWQGRADVWYLDGFSPARNPELWGEDLLKAVADRSAKGATFATYTAAGHVRRGLEAVGFDVQRAPGYGRKRHMSLGTLKDLQ